MNQKSGCQKIYIRFDGPCLRPHFRQTVAVPMFALAACERCFGPRHFDFCLFHMVETSCSSCTSW